MSNLTADSIHRPSNKLLGEKSPYLLQHVHNPVDWHPWGDEAFERAVSVDKPIFLSIGYSTCHWCHVMERESFEDDEVAQLLNKGFVSIKVDREERPDIDAVYMTVCQMMTGSGGWPLTIIMTPEKKPFFAATYIPKGSRLAHVGLMELLPRVQEIWKTRRDEVHRNGERVVQVLATHRVGASTEDLDTDVLERARRNLSLRFDSNNGGFGSAPKFPTPHNLTFLLRDWKRHGRTESLHMVETTLTAMRRGGVYDQVGFGFHRYSTDGEWLVPHFEKMLYDQALLVMAFVETYQATGKTEYAVAAREVIEYVLRDMTASEGGFYSAEDADSEGEEGKFYLWSAEELKNLLSAEDADRLIRVFTMTDEGNFADEASGERTGRNIAHLNGSPSEVADELGMSTSSYASWLSKVRAMLLEHRSTRIRPSLDDKVLTDWNGLMIAALARAGSVLDEPRYIDAAQRAASFIQDTMVESNGGALLHRYRDGEAAVSGFVDDYSFLTWGLLELYEATFEAKYLAEAMRLTDDLLEHFWDADKGGLFLTSDEGELILTRHKDAYDGATPSGNSVAAVNLVRLARMTGDGSYEERAERVIASSSEFVVRAPEGFTHLLQALDMMVGPTFEVVIVGEDDDGDTRAMMRALRESFIPGKVVLFRRSDDDSSELDHLAPFTRDMAPIDGKATAYVCTGQACDLPTADVERMLELVGASAS